MGLLPFTEGFFCFDLALTAWGERGGSTTWLCRPAGREMGARSPPSAPQPRCPTLPASCGVWDNCGGGFPLLASKSTAVSPRRGGFQRREMSETEREGLALEGSLSTHTPPPPHTSNPHSCPCSSSHSPSTEAPCPLSQDSPEPPFPIIHARFSLI